MKMFLPTDSSGMASASKKLLRSAEGSSYSGPGPHTNSFKLNELAVEYPGLHKYTYWSMSAHARGAAQEDREMCMAAFRQRRRTDPEFGRQLKREERAFADGDFEAVDDLPDRVRAKYFDREVTRDDPTMGEKERLELERKAQSDLDLLCIVGKRKG